MADAADPFRLARFQPLVGSCFPLRLEDAGSLPVRLIEARAGGAAAPGGRQPFSLTFEAPAEPALPQRIYRLEHEALAALEIFLVPVALRPTGLHYEAVFG